jgi:hypothetical protein
MAGSTPKKIAYVSPGLINCILRTGWREVGGGRKEEGRGKREEGGEREEGKGKREEGRGKREDNLHRGSSLPQNFRPKKHSSLPGVRGCPLFRFLFPRSGKRIPPKKE